MQDRRQLGQYRSRRDWGRHDKRACGLAVDKEPIKHCLKITKSSDVHLEQETILARDPVAFAHLGAVLRELDDTTHLAGRRSEPHPSRDRKTKCGWVNVEPHAADRPDLF